MDGGSNLKRWYRCKCCSIRLVRVHGGSSLQASKHKSRTSVHVHTKKNTELDSNEATLMMAHVINTNKPFICICWWPNMLEFTRRSNAGEPWTAHTRTLDELRCLVPQKRQRFLLDCICLKRNKQLTTAATLPERAARTPRLGRAIPQPTYSRTKPWRLGRAPRTARAHEHTFLERCWHANKQNRLSVCTRLNQRVKTPTKQMVASSQYLTWSPSHFQFNHLSIPVNQKKRGFPSRSSTAGCSQIDAYAISYYPLQCCFLLIVSFYFI
jgi:hypothetical protein